jgi:LPXTG-site transpeptidase (sortase) family protein
VMAAVIAGAALAGYAAFSAPPASAPPPARAIEVEPVVPLLIDAFVAPTDGLLLPPHLTEALEREAGASGTLAPERAAAPPAISVQNMRLQLPGFGVDSPVLNMGFDRNSGEMQIPHEAHLVAWYDFSAAPGQPGNAVFAAHVDWRGARGAFWDLRHLQVGDEITVEADGKVLRYQVFEAYHVRPDEADMSVIIGQRSGPETITLITCGGNFNTSIRAYEERVIVRAERIDDRSGPDL